MEKYKEVERPFRELWVDAVDAVYGLHNKQKMLDSDDFELGIDFRRHRTMSVRFGPRNIIECSMASASWSGESGPQGIWHHFLLETLLLDCESRGRSVSIKHEDDGFFYCEVRGFPYQYKAHWPHLALLAAWIDAY